MPQNTLTLVGEILKDMGSIQDQDLEDLLLLFETAKSEVIEEMERRAEKAELLKPRLALIFTKKD